MQYESLTETQVEHSTHYEGAVVTVYHDKVRLIDGQIAGRDVVHHSGGVAILALSAEDQVTLVDQFRYPVGKIITELPAGKLDWTDGQPEDHRQAALRELREETGLVPQSLTYLGYILASPGFCDEVLHMYLAQDLEQEAAQPDQDEFLNCYKIPFAQLVEQVMAGTIVDGKTVATVLKVKEVLGK